MTDKEKQIEEMAKELKKSSTAYLTKWIIGLELSPA